MKRSLRSLQERKSTANDDYIYYGIANLKRAKKDETVGSTATWCLDSHINSIFNVLLRLDPKYCFNSCSIRRYNSERRSMRIGKYFIHFTSFCSVCSLYNMNKSEKKYTRGSSNLQFMKPPANHKNAKEDSVKILEKKLIESKHENEALKETLHQMETENEKTIKLLRDDIEYLIHENGKLTSTVKDLKKENEILM